MRYRTMLSRSRVLHLLVIVALLLSALPAPTVAQAVSPDLVISQIYGGGGNTGAVYTYDFVELFNRGTQPVSLAGKSIQYTSAVGTGNFGATATQLTELPSVTLLPGQYFLVQEARGAGTFADLPTPDVIDPSPIAMSGTTGKVALVNSTSTLGCNGGSTACSPAQLTLIIDLVGFGGANFYEGAGPTPVLSNSTAALRNNNGCTDTDNNSADFTVAAPAPRNTASPLNTCVAAAAEPKLNEFSHSTTGTDVEYVEIYGTPNNDYSAYTILEIEGDSTLTGAGAGVIDEVIPVGTTGASGFWLGSLPANALENGSITLLVVKNFTGALTNDLDTDNNGAFDVMPWEAVVDAVAVNDGGGSDVTYGIPVLGVSYDGLTFAPGGASRIPDGFDTDAASDWVRNDFDLAGIPGFTGTPVEGEAYNTPGAANEVYVLPPLALGTCEDTFTAIYTVQGAGAASPWAGSPVVVEGIVVGDFQNNASPDSGSLNGFHLQDPAGDNDTATSDGVFIFAPGGMDVAVGETVRVLGVVSEFNGMTEITASEMLVCSSGVSISPTAISLPAASVDAFEAYEGMLVTFPQPLVIAEYFNFDRFNEIVLSSTRHQTPTALYEPGPDAMAAIQAFLLDRITLDDGRTNQNPDPALHPNGAVFDLSNLFRGGDTLANVTGVMDYSFGLYRIQPTKGADYSSANPRTAAPEAVGGSLKVASFNVLNYFDTLDLGPDICGPLENQECRGADNAEEFARQRSKIIAALAAINADIVGLIEIENDPGGAVANLVDGLNEVVGAGTYAYLDTGTIGTDAIKQALIYKPATVSLVGAHAILDSSVDPRFLDDKNRPVLAQTFMESSTGGIFTVAVNHLKSKGSACNDVGDPDLGDGAGNCNLTRLAAAQALVDWLATDPTASGVSSFLIIGDLNSYDKEDPIDAIKAGADDTAGTVDDYTDLVLAYQGEEAYSYVFDGQTGYLDHALASTGLLDKVTGTTVWHINADEPDLIDYDTQFKAAAQDAIFAPDAYRSSDHDPVIVGLVLNAPPTVSANGPYQVIEGAAVTLIASGSDPDGDVLSYAWDLDNDGIFETPGEAVTFDAASLAALTTHTVRVQATDPFGLSDVDETTVFVLYNFSGFFPPVLNWPEENVVNAGSTITIRFSLNGDKGLDIFEAGYPLVEIISGVDSGKPKADSASLHYDPETGEYLYLWKTDKSWAGTTRRLVIVLKDGTEHQLLFTFVK